MLWARRSLLNGGGAAFSVPWDSPASLSPRGASSTPFF